MKKGGTEGRYTEVLKVRIDSRLLKLAKEKAESLDMDMSAFVRWCIRTGLILGDLNEFVRSRIGKES